MHRIEEEDRNKVYEVLNKLYSIEGRDTRGFEVKYTYGEKEYYIYRMVTNFANTVGIVDYVYDKSYQSDEDSRSRSVVQKWTLDIPAEMMEKAIEAYGDEESILNNFEIVKLFKDAGIEGTEKLGKWFIRHLEIDGLLNMYDETNGKAKPKKNTTDEVAAVEAENSEYHGGTYDV